MHRVSRTQQAARRSHRRLIRAVRSHAGGHVRGPYDRARDLARLLPLLDADAGGASPDQRARIIALLRRALRAERMRAHVRHWTYDPGRHAALLRATRAEEAELRRTGKPEGPSFELT